MTSFLSPGGGVNKPGTDTRALQEINSRKKSFVNKDFAKNMAYLNNSVDTLSQWSQKLQSGVDQANSNIIEQIQGFAGDLFVLFAGLEPTGMDLGDLKYVIQGIGAFFGINPSTPFPLNLIEAAGHFFTTYIIPLDQFTDVIFDAIFAWAEDLGLSSAFIDSIRDLLSAIEGLGAAFGDIFNAIKDVLGAFGFLGFTSTSGLGSLWDGLLDILEIISIPLKPVLALLADLGIPFINALTGIIQGVTSFLTPLSWISGAQIQTLGPNIAPKPMNDTTVWGVAGSPAGGWFFDSTQSSSSKSVGSFTTLGNGAARRMLTQNFFECTPGQTFAANAMLKWIGISSLSNEFGIALVWYTDDNEISQTNLNIAGGHGSSGGWADLVGNFTVPADINRFKIAVRIGNSYPSGQLWVDDISIQLQGTIRMSLIDGLIDFLDGLLPFSLFDVIIGVKATVENVVHFFGNLLNPSSPISVFNLFGLLPPWVLPSIPLGNLTNQAPELLISTGFETASVIQLGQNWAWDGTTGRTTNGSARVTANSVGRVMVSNEIPVTQGDLINISVWSKWMTAVYGGVDHINLEIAGYKDGVLFGTANIAKKTIDSYTNATWQQLSGSFTCPNTIDSVRLQLRIGSNVSSGLIWFDDASMKRPRVSMPQSWVLNLIPDLGGLQQYTGNVIDIFLRVIRGVPVVGGTLTELTTDMLDWYDDTQNTAAMASDAYIGVTTLEPVVAEATQAIINQQNFTITTQVVGAGNPSWVCRYPYSDVTYAEILQSEWAVFGDTGAASTGTAHTHVVEGLDDLQAEPGAWSVEVDNSRGGILTIGQSRKHDTCGMWLRKSTSDPINNVFVEIFKENLDGSTGQVILSQDVSSVLTTGGIKHIEFPIDGGLVVQTGEKYLVRVRNSSTVPNTVDVAGIRQQSFAVDASFRTSTAVETTRTSYTPTQYANGKTLGVVLPFCMLAAKNQLVTDKSYPDNFNRVNLGNLWSISGSAPNQLIIRNNMLSYGGGLQGTQTGTYNRTVESDNMRVDGRLIGTPSGRTTNPYSGLIVCSDSNRTNYVFLGVNAGTVKVASFVGGTLTTRTSTSGGADAIWSIYYDLASNKFKVLKDDVPVPALDWLDSGNIISHGPDNRFGGGRIEAALFFVDHTRGADIDDWNVKDWVE